ncbi:hypothetical protein GCM10009715_04050 [Paeniglutamicibacter psychrophenolicus]|uniref:THIF-type NAD/FAD binding fold domain-containing protein n=1 Tax=Paeniglutamicibacter psychrophenolicus TaxID=257454 RepID=A0ABS4WDC7_9MICC|nr:ThiF family adenylyltransferase [Paeniglutamicibacter psychrophenolicus]MBP2374207.1 hypothetical protein [Paeniglutamicibacter psychrophenolicus]
MRINPGLQVLSLMEGVVQIGTGQRARWITGLSAAEKRFVLSLGNDGQGTAAPVDPTQDRPKGQPREQGPDATRRSEILAMLAPVLLDTPARTAPGARPGSGHGLGHGLGARLVPDVRQWSAAYQMDAAEVLERRAGARVAVQGCGRMGQLLAHILAAAGVGSLMLSDAASMDAGDLGAGTTGIGSVGTPRARATARALAPLYPHLVVAETGQRSPDAPPLDMAVVISGGMLPPLESLATDAAVLPVLFTDSGMNLGPLCLPGLTMCERCVWEQCDPTLRLLADAGIGARVPGLRPEASLAAVAAGMAAMQVLMVLDRINIPSAAGSMLVCDLPTGSTTMVPAKTRPRCNCLDSLAA